MNTGQRGIKASSEVRRFSNVEAALYNVGEAKRSSDLRWAVRSEIIIGRGKVRRTVRGDEGLQKSKSLRSSKRDKTRIVETPCCRSGGTSKRLQLER